MEDHMIIDLYWKRCESAITESSNKYGNYCHTISYNILHNSEDVSECVNDTWLAAWNTMPPKRPDLLGAFLGKITRNLSLNRYKSNSAQKRGGSQTELALTELEECISDGNPVEESMDQMALTKAIESYLMSQSSQRRKIFVRRYWYLSPIDEIAADFSMSRSKATSLLFRMRKELKLHLEKEGILI